ncbi:MAG: hypothetical protein P1U38_13665 [Aeromicrobium sp.]|uniref:hypothetical protein n=1 Tax=Aeromicrobium sp. TaxID=1871063 RepID=UPI00262D4996|nr:hypothetical protein [Aeromicrobium sp.]MDF1705812.1 hypothetical protein [Aeromicrobium sp.]
MTIVLLAGCQRSEGDPPTSSPDSTPTATPSWEDGLADDEVDAAYEAIDFLHSYDVTIEGFVESGKATPEAMEYLQDNHAVWTPVWEGLQAAEAEGRTSVTEQGWDVTTTPTEVTVQPDGYALVEITRCVDPSKTTDYVNGVEQASVDVPSYEQYVGLQRESGGDWLISGISADVEATCDLAAG